MNNCVLKTRYHLFAILTNYRIKHLHENAGVPDHYKGTIKETDLIETLQATSGDITRKQ